MDEVKKMAGKLAREFNHAAVQRCIDCRGCEKDCPSFKLLEGYDPTKVNQDILAYDVEKWLTSPVIWQCLECHTCSEMCPQGHSWEKVFTTFKAAAMETGTAPKSVMKAWAVFSESGMLAAVKSTRSRDKLGLPPVSQSGSDEFKAVYEQLIKSGKADES